MSTKLENFIKSYLKTDLPDIRPGDTIRVYQKIPASPSSQKSKNKDQGSKEKTQAFEGVVIARKHGKGISATITVRKVIDNIGVEKIFPIHSPSIEKIEILKTGKVRRAKLYYFRKAPASQILRIKPRIDKKEKTESKAKRTIKAIDKEKPIKKISQENKEGEEIKK